MTARPAPVLLAILALTGSTAAPASRRPCRDAEGKIVTCAKPKAPAPQRCKDEKGRFVPCDRAGAKPAR